MRQFVNSACVIAICAALASSTSAASLRSSAQLSPFANDHLSGLESVGSGTTYTADTRIGTSAGSFLLSATTPDFDNIVPFNLAEDQISSYDSTLGLDVKRYQTETVVNNGNGTATTTFRTIGRTAAGAPADLFPEGFTSGTTALADGFLFVGAGAASVGGNDAVDWSGIAITSASLSGVSDGAPYGPLALTPATFFPTPWNGLFGIRLTGWNVGLDNEIALSVTYAIPEPTTLGLLAGVGLVALRRKSR